MNVREMSPEEKRLAGQVIVAQEIVDMAAQELSDATDDLAATRAMLERYRAAHGIGTADVPGLDNPTGQPVATEAPAPAVHRTAAQARQWEQAQRQKGGV